MFLSLGNPQGHPDMSFRGPLSLAPGRVSLSGPRRPVGESRPYRPSPTDSPSLSGKRYLVGAVGGTR